MTFYLSLMLLVILSLPLRAESNDMPFKNDESSIRQMEREAKNAPAKDKASYRKLIQALQKKDQNPKASFRRTVKAEAEFISEMLKLHSTDKQMTFNLILAEHNLGAATQAEPDREIARIGKKLVKTAQTRTDAFVKKHSGIASAHLLKARVTRDPSVAKTEAKKCLEIEPANQACEELLKGSKK